MLTATAGQCPVLHWGSTPLALSAQQRAAKLLPELDNSSSLLCTAVKAAFTWPEHVPAGAASRAQCQQHRYTTHLEAWLAFQVQTMTDELLFYPGKCCGHQAAMAQQSTVHTTDSPWLTRTHIVVPCTTPTAVACSLLCQAQHLAASTSTHAALYHACDQRKPAAAHLRHNAVSHCWAHCWAQNIHVALAEALQHSRVPSATHSKTRMRAHGCRASYLL